MWTCHTVCPAAAPTWLLGPDATGMDGVKLAADVAAQCGLGPAGAMLARADGYVAEVR